MNDSDSGFSFLAGMMVGVVIIVLAFLFIGSTVEDASRKRAVEKKFAQYNSETGKFEWINKDVGYVVDGIKE